MDVDNTQIVKDLAEAVSTQARVANRAWLATMTLALLMLLPPSPTEPGKTVTVTLPFGLGAVPPTVFYPLGFMMLAVLVVALAVAHAQQMRANRLAQRTLDGMSQPTIPGSSLTARELFDILRVPSLSRVAPLAQWILDWSPSPGKPGSSRQWIGGLSAAYYLTLKLFAFVVLFIIPMLGLWAAYRQMSTNVLGLQFVALQAVGVVAAFSLGMVAVADLKYVIAVAALLARKR